MPVTAFGFERLGERGMERRRWREGSALSAALCRCLRKGWEEASDARPWGLERKTDPEVT